MARKKLLVCDLDNTLYDWVGYFVPSFYAMVDEAVRISGCQREDLLNDLQAVHRYARDAEHPFALLETNCIRQRYVGISDHEIAKTLDPAFYAFNSARKKYLHIYPGVRETLEWLKSEDVKLVAHTESKLHGVVDRLRRLSLQQYFSKIYCRERVVHATVDPKRKDWLNGFPIDRVVELSHHQSKPNRDVLLEICGAEDVLASDAAYVGDSLSKDILMANWAGVFSIWAEYGTKHDPSDYTSLVRVSHWTKEDIDSETKLKKLAQSAIPDAVAHSSFREVREIMA